MELSVSTKLFTWSDFREDAALAKLDKCFVSLEWHYLYPLANLLALVRTTSDHTLLLQLTGKSCCKKSSAKPFRFENLWFQHAGFEEQVSSWWASVTATEDAAENMVKKLSFLRSKLRC